MSVNVKVCMGTHCTMLGNLNLYEDLEDLSKEYPGKINLETVKCLKVCDNGDAPVVSINGEMRKSAKAEKIISEIIGVIEK